MEAAYRSIIEMTQGHVTPLDLDRMTITQILLYFEKPKLTEEQAIKLAKQRAAQRGK